MNLCCCLVYGNKPFDLQPMEKFNPGIENPNVGNSNFEYNNWKLKFQKYLSQLKTV